ncbi:class I SAM-dependent methyltransferase [Thermomonas sp. HDW16]|uniref:class I SAM-dependent DNA methyltransferase n=1 Tax=Thermomonas sp. HDW16 TaxID=2714945 RepID=UPI00140AB628|nr:class I SAM-dependent methyltransferase [Thermomonas sp. HDW16]QIL21427.1 class I SAM-dependent methyltransferase [Thermomonas sp. HDW16]
MTEPFDAYAAYYDLLYQDKDYAADASYILELLSEQDIRSGSILELGCGTGRHAEYFHASGFSIDGYDLSANMVAAAANRLPASPDIHFSVGDARTIRTGKRYDAVLALFHVVSYQATNKDLHAVLDTAASHLEPDGVFIFDCWYGPGVLMDPPSDRLRQVEDDSLTITRKATPVVHPRKNLVDVNYEITATSKLDGSRRTVLESHRMRYLFEPEIHLMLDACGLRMTAAYAYPTKREPALDTWQAIFVASPR